MSLSHMDDTCLAFLGRIIILDSVGYPVPASIIFLKILGKFSFEFRFYVELEEM